MTDREKIHDPIYTTCNLCGVIVMHDTPPQCGDSDCPFVEEWSDPPLTDSQKSENYLQKYGNDYCNMGEPHQDSDEYEGDGTCTKCEGAGSWLLNSCQHPTQTHPNEETCSHCKGAGEEPK